MDNWIDMAWPFIWAIAFAAVYLEHEAVVIE
jgi:hypothetical protein